MSNYIEENLNRNEKIVEKAKLNAFGVGSDLDLRNTVFLVASYTDD